ncbi:MAG: hypothetical protein J6Y60_13295 [Treponema sp.]|nr:hypothetical protein [Treponema sp.]
MKKTALLAAFSLFSAALFAYNPPFGGENLYKLSNPTLMSGGDSASGGPLFNVIPASISYNPALTAIEQRTVLNLSGSLMFNAKNFDSSSLGWGAQAGITMPTKWMVFSGTINAVFSGEAGLPVGNTIIVHAGIAKELLDDIYIGLNLYGGSYFSHGSDWSIGCDFGLLYKGEKSIGLLREPRIGLSVLNIGRSAGNDYEVPGVDGTFEGTAFPGILTPRISLGATVLQTWGWKAGFSADASFPACKNAVFDLAFAVSYNDLVELNVGWQANVRELAEGGKANWLSIGLSCKIMLSSSKKNDTWQQSEIVPSVAWQNMYSEVQNISAGATLYLGQEDNEAPEIYLWDEDVFGNN